MAQNGMRKFVKTAGRTVSSLLLAGPLVVPAYDAVKFGLLGTGGGAAGVNPVHEFVFSATSYHMPDGKLDTEQLTRVAKRDAVLVSAGLIGRWLMKKV